MKSPEFKYTVRAPNSNKERQIDYIFTNDRFTSARKVTEPREIGSDHALI